MSDVSTYIHSLRQHSGLLRELVGTQHKEAANFFDSAAQRGAEGADPGYIEAVESAGVGALPIAAGVGGMAAASMGGNYAERLLRLKYDPVYQKEMERAYEALQKQLNAPGAKINKIRKAAKVAENAALAASQLRTQMAPKGFPRGSLAAGKAGLGLAAGAGAYYLANKLLNPE
jgi:hypothetical protein